MPDMIGFLERMGADARLRGASSIDIEAAMSTEGFDSSIREAVASKDWERLHALLGANLSVCCGLHAPEDDDAESDWLEMRRHLRIAA